MLRSWEGHYRTLTHMAFTDDGSHLVTCSEDSLVRVWSCGQLLDYNGTINARAALLLIMHAHKQKQTRTHKYTRLSIAHHSCSPSAPPLLSLPHTHTRTLTHTHTLTFSLLLSFAFALPLSLHLSHSLPLSRLLFFAVHLIFSFNLSVFSLRFCPRSSLPPSCSLFSMSSLTRTTHHSSCVYVFVSVSVSV